MPEKIGINRWIYRYIGIGRFSLYRFIGIGRLIGVSVDHYTKLLIGLHINLKIRTTLPKKRFLKLVGMGQGCGEGQMLNIARKLLFWDSYNFCGDFSICLQGRGSGGKPEAPPPPRGQPGMLRIHCSMIQSQPFLQFSSYKDVPYINQQLLTSSFH